MERPDSGVKPRQDLTRRDDYGGNFEVRWFNRRVGGAGSPPNKVVRELLEESARQRGLAGAGWRRHDDEQAALGLGHGAHQSTFWACSRSRSSSAFASTTMPIPARLLRVSGSTRMFLISGLILLLTSRGVPAGATVIQGRRIGKNAVVGAGAVVIHDVPADTTVVGVPARVIRSQSNEVVGS